MRGPILSVVVPSYNQAAFIEETITQPLSLRDEGVETLVVDGGSSDGTKAILERVGDKLSYWVSEPDDGQADAINKGFSHTSGEWIAFQNSDDFYLPGMLAKLLPIMRERSDIDLIIGGAMFTDVDGIELRRTFPKPIPTVALARMNFIQNQSMFIRRRLFEKVGGVRTDAQFCLDYEWFLRIFKMNPKILYFHEIVGAQRLHENTKTSNNQSTHDVEFDRFSRLHFTEGERRSARFLIPPYLVFRKIFGWVASYSGTKETVRSPDGWLSVLGNFKNK